jgi:hypothetical protein
VKIEVAVKNCFNLIGTTESTENDRRLYRLSNSL